MIYQSQSGDADTGTGSFTCESSTIEILSSSSVYSEAPMFYITNTAATISLTGCTFTYGSGTFLLADEGDWGSSGSNGGTVTLTLTNQAIVGDIEVGSSSSLTITLVNSSINGKINTDKTAAKLAITLDAASTINLTGDSYYTSLTILKLVVILGNHIQNLLLLQVEEALLLQLTLLAIQAPQQEPQVLLILMYLIHINLLRII